MYEAEPFTLNFRYLKVKKYTFFWTSFLLFLSLALIWFSSSYPITNYQIYQGIVVKQENEYFVKLYMSQEKTPTFMHSKLTINRQNRNFEVIKITNSYELGFVSGYVEFLLKMELQDSEKIENNLLEITSLESRQTLFQKWSETFKKRVKI